MRKGSQAINASPMQVYSNNNVASQPLILAASPLSPSSHILDILKRATHAHDAVPYKPWIQTERALDSMLHARRRIEAHEKVVARVMQRAVLV